MFVIVVSLAPQSYTFCGQRTNIALVMKSVAAYRWILLGTGPIFIYTYFATPHLKNKKTNCTKKNRGGYSIELMINLLRIINHPPSLYFSPLGGLHRVRLCPTLTCMLSDV